jgi:hypothetical protein
MMHAYNGKTIHLMNHESTGPSSLYLSLCDAALESPAQHYIVESKDSKAGEGV